MYYVHSNPSGDPLVLYDLRSQQSSSGSHIPPGKCHFMQLQRNTESGPSGTFSELPFWNTSKAINALVILVAVTLTLVEVKA